MSQFFLSRLDECNYNFYKGPGMSVYVVVANRLIWGLPLKWLSYGSLCYSSDSSQCCFTDLHFGNSK